MKKKNNIIIIIFSILSIMFLVKDINLGNSDRYLADLTFPLVLVLSKLFSYIFKVKISDNLEFSYLVFVILADFLGSIVNLYTYTWWYDLFTHFLSGIATSIVAVMLLDLFKINKDSKLFVIIFIISFSLMIASLWEFTEFLTDYFLKLDVQHHLTTGVYDTMEDMLVAFVGSIIVSVTYMFDKGKKRINKVVSGLIK